MNSVHDPVLDLRGVDLDLLVSLDVLLRTRSVTRAAGEVGISQSAMSHALRRLRGHFDDPLLVRLGGTMAPTPLAEALETPLRAALVGLQRAIAAPAPFTPASAARTFHLSAPDLFNALLLPDLMRTVRAQAPGVDLVVRARPEAAATRDLAAGALDLALVPIPDPSELDLPAGPTGGELVRQTLFHDGFRCYLREGHPALRTGGRIALEDWLALGHVLVSPDGRGPGVVDHALAQIGRQRRIVLRLPGFAAAPQVVAGTDLVLTAPASLARACEGLSVCDLPPPLDLPGHAVAMYWHRRLSADPALTWLRQVIRDVARHAGPR